MEITEHPETLDAMLADMASADDLYRPTPYWRAYVERSSIALQHGSLAKFRGASAKDFKGFVHMPDRERLHPSGATRLAFQLALKLPAFGLLARRYEAVIDHAFLNNVTNQRRLARALYYYASGIDTANQLGLIEDSGVGAPGDLFEVDGRLYTLGGVLFFLRYLSVSQTIDSLNLVLELGPGYGGQAEIFLKLRPELKYVVIDLPPMAYITERYLQAIFPDKVLGYLATRDLESIGPDDVRDHQVIVLCPWQMPRLNLPVDLFWNAASFQEMERDVVSNYLDLVENLGTKRILLYTLKEGLKPGTAGQTAAVSGQWLSELLSKHYELINDPVNDSNRFGPHMSEDYGLYLLERRAKLMG